MDILAGKADLGKFDWLDCPDEWQAPFMPLGKGAYFDWPRAVDLFPYHSCGDAFYRSWPIGETESVLGARWERLRTAKARYRKALFKETRDRKIVYTVAQPDLSGHGEPSIRDLTPATPQPRTVRYGYRSFDRQFAFHDLRVGDRIRPSLGRLHGEKQTFLVCPDTLICGRGAICSVSADIPDQHYFRGRGGKDVIPLYRDAAGTEPNVTAGRFGPVLPQVWEFEVSGFKVVQSWLGYRMKKRAGKKSSPLDDIRPECWTARMSDELLELLWVLEAILAMEPELEKALDRVVAGPCFAAADLPTPTPGERKAPSKAAVAEDQPDLFGDDDDAGEDDGSDDD